MESSKAMVFTKAYEAISDAFELYRDYAMTRLKEEQFKKLISDAEALRVKYNNSTFANDVIIAVVNEIGRIQKYKG